MPISPEQLLVELKGLRRGRGVYSSDVTTRAGAQLRELCRIGSSDPPAVVRQKLSDRLTGLAGTLPDELRVAALVALAIHPQARQLLLQDRLDWFAEHLARDGRTARRRVDEGLARLADSAIGVPAPAEVLPDGSVGGWYVGRFDSVVRMDRPRPESRERRVVVAERAGISEINLAMTLPREHGDLAGDVALDVDVDFGGSLLRGGPVTGSRLEWVLALPAPLQVGQDHEYGVTFRMPEGRAMRPHYVFTPARRCDVFDLRIRFDPARAPEKVWRVERAFHRDLDDGPPVGAVVPIDSAGEVHAVFTNLHVGFGYGLRWNPPDR